MTGTTSSVTFTRHFWPYIRTDHNSLAWLNSFMEPDGQIARWLQEYNFEVFVARKVTIVMQMLYPTVETGEEEAKTARIVAALVEQVQRCETAASG